MSSSKQLAGLIGPTIIVVTISETVNIHIWAANSAANIYANGTLLFVAGLAIVRVHHNWALNWTLLITLIGWLAMVLGLFRMFFPDLQLEMAKNNSTTIIGAILTLTIGVVLIFKAYFNKD